MPPHGYSTVTLIFLGPLEPQGSTLHQRAELLLNWDLDPIP